mmetsp:Transcript_14577/g.40510  ORF Transcript_14577/g.40510 Transcript_14577/m.40510 type:complete len:211 (-) Transcript_14577:259-891(-)
MVSTEAFLPVPTEEDLQVPQYRPDGPSSLHVEDGSSDDLGFNTSNHHLLFCGVCCDHRRAVLVVNAISIAFRLLAMIIVVIGASFFNKNLDEIEAEVTDDQYRKQLDEFAKEGGIQIVEAIFEFFFAISILLHACGIYGALQFKQWGIITAASTYALSFLSALISMNLLDIIMSGLFLYPHIYMLKLMREGIMTDYNYHKIATCCGSRHL